MIADEGTPQVTDRYWWRDVREGRRARTLLGMNSVGAFTDPQYACPNRPDFGGGWIKDSRLQSPWAAANGLAGRKEQPTPLIGECGCPGDKEQYRYRGADF